MTSNPQDAIHRARRHLRNAAREGLEASRALIEAALLTGSLAEAADSDGRGGVAAEVKATLDAWIATLESDQAFRMPSAFAEPLQRALKIEIDRWERRSAEDEAARPVLRAFLTLRELLWEFGMRDAPSSSERSSRAPHQKSAPRSRSKSPRQRVQRFDLED